MAAIKTKDFWEKMHCRLQTGPINVNMRSETLCIILSVFFWLCYTKLCTNLHVNTDFFLLEFFSKDSLSCSELGATHV